MLEAVIKSIKRQYILPQSEYEWIKENLNKPLRMASISFDADTGEVDMLVVRMNADAVVVLFVDDSFGNGNGVEFELVGDLLFKPKEVIKWQLQE